MISVAMCTYNGARYINEQLMSIVNQSTPVHELVVCDDRSKDNTVALLQEFAQTAPFPVHIHVNETNLGSTKNFEKCLSLCQGEFVFLTDQDDAWLPNKVTAQMNFFQDHPEMDAVFSNGYTMDDDSKRKQESIWDHISFNADQQAYWHSSEGFQILFDHFVVTGATLAVRKAAIEALMPFPTNIDKYIHDAWIALALKVQGRIGYIDQPLISYRLHASQQVGFGGSDKAVTLWNRFSRDRNIKLQPIQNKATLYKNMYAALSNLKGIQTEKLLPLIDRQQHYETRASYPNNRLLRIMPALKELSSGRYKYSSKDWWLPLLGDIFE